MGTSINMDNTSDMQQVKFVHTPKDSGRIRMALDLAIKLNDTFILSTDLDEILHAVLVGVTAGEGLGFNRAILIRADHNAGVLHGEYGVGPASKEAAHKIWTEIDRYSLSLFDILKGVTNEVNDYNHPVNKLARNIVVPLNDYNNVLVRSLRDRRALLFNFTEIHENSSEMELSSLLGTDQFAIAPLVSGGQSYGLIIADNCISGRPIHSEDVEALELFSSLASIGLSKAYMCTELQDRLGELERLYDDLERNKDLLIEAERYTALGRMADQLLHEIRNPLSALGGMANILIKKAVDPTVKNYAEIIVKETTRLECIVRKLFDFTQSPVLDIKPVGLYGLITAVTGILASEMERQDVELSMTLPEPEPILNLDSTHIRQVFLNILKNALDAMPDGGKITITVEKHTKKNNCNCLYIHIEDTGLGMPRAHTLKATEPFFTTKSYGMGLGLSLAKRIVEMHRGTLCLSCNNNKGTRVTITLPLDDSHMSNHHIC